MNEREKALQGLRPEIRDQLDRERLLKDGYLIIRDLVSSERLDSLRGQIEKMVDRRKAESAANKADDEPQGGAWSASAQPRLKFDEDYDEETTGAIEFCVQPETLGVSQFVMDASEASVTYMACMCSPETDRGPAKWHRDTNPVLAAPLQGLLSNSETYGPGYVQWNIPLYDDGVFWIVPGSHRRINSVEENAQFEKDASQPMPGGIPVELNAGDGVVYVHLMLHWGSNYTTRLRRTVHLGYRRFGGDGFPVVHWRHWEPTLPQELPEHLQGPFNHFDGLYRDELAVFESLFQAVIDADGERFRSELSRLHPSREGQMVAIVLLSKIAGKLSSLARTPELERSGQVPWYNEGDFRDLAGGFSAEEAMLLGKRFEETGRRLQHDEEQVWHGFQGVKSKYEMNQMPENFGVEDFIASWG